MCPLFRSIMSQWSYAVQYPSRKEFLEDYRRRTAGVRGLYDRVGPG
jgi:hypothetical protein